MEWACPSDSLPQREKRWPLGLQSWPCCSTGHSVWDPGPATDLHYRRLPGKVGMTYARAPLLTGMAVDPIHSARPLLLPHLLPLCLFCPATPLGALIHNLMGLEVLEMGDCIRLGL